MLCTPSLGDSCRETESAARPVRPTDRWSTPTVDMLRTILSAVREGLAAQRRYKHLTSKGVHHDLSIRQAFGISHPASVSDERRRCRRFGNSA